MESLPPTPTPTPSAGLTANKTVLIVAGFILLCCCCLGLLGAAWAYGDMVLQALGL